MTQMCVTEAEADRRAVAARLGGQAALQRAGPGDRRARHAARRPPRHRRWPTSTASRRADVVHELPVVAPVHDRGGHVADPAQPRSPSASSACRRVGDGDRAGRSASSRSPQTTAAAALLRRVTGLVLSMEHEEPAVDRLLDDARAGRGGSWRRCVPADPRPAIGAARRRRRPRLPRPRRATSAPTTRASPSTTITVDGDRAVGHGRRSRSPTRARPASSTAASSAVFFDCVVQHHNCDVGVAGKTTSLAVRFRRPTPLLTAAALRRSSAQRRRRTASARPRGCCTTTRCSCEAEVGPSPATGPTCPTVSPRRTRAVTAHDRGRRRRRPAAHRAGAAARPSGRPRRRGLLVVRRRRRSPTPRPTAARPSSPGGCSAVGAGQGTPRRDAAPQRPRVRRRRGSPRPASAPSTVPLSTFSTRAELAGSCAAPTSRVLLARRGLPRPRLRRRRLRGRASPSSTSRPPPPLFAPSAPALRRIAFAVDAADAASTPAWTTAGRCSARGGAGGRRPDVLAAAEAAVTPADRMVIVHTSGSTSEPKGVVHTHGALIRHLDNLNELRRYTPDEVLFSNSPFFWIGGFAYACSARSSPAPRLVCSNAADGGRRARRPRARAADDGERVRGQRSPTCPTTRASPAATCRRSGGATSTRSCPRRCGRTTPSCATPCSA